MSTLKAPLLQKHENNTTEKDYFNVHSSQTSDVDVVVQTQNAGSLRDDKIHSKCNIFQYLILLIIAIIYLIYGLIKTNDATKYPLIKSYEESISEYPIPASIACVPLATNNDTSYYFNVIGVFINYDTICEGIHGIQTNNSQRPCSTLQQTDITSISSLKSVQDWQILHEYIPDAFMECFMIISPANITYIHLYEIEYVYWSSGYMKKDIYLSNESDFAIPSFMSNQNLYTITYNAFHIDEFIQNAKQIFDINSNNVKLSDVLYDAYSSFDSVFYATPFSLNTIMLRLKQTTKLNGDILYSFEKVETPPLTTVAQNTYKNCTHYTNDTCSVISIRYETSNKDDAFLIQKNDYYVDYDYFDLLSGFGGIVSGANGVLITFLSLLLFGFTFTNCIHFKGLAPYPNFDDNFKERIQRLVG